MFLTGGKKSHPRTIQGTKCIKALSAIFSWSPSLTVSQRIFHHASFLWPHSDTISICSNSLDALQWLILPYVQDDRSHALFLFVIRFIWSTRWKETVIKEKWSISEPEYWKEKWYNSERWDRCRHVSYCLYGVNPISLIEWKIITHLKWRCCRCVSVGKNTSDLQ